MNLCSSILRGSTRGINFEEEVGCFDGWNVLYFEISQDMMWNLARVSLPHERSN